MRQPSNNSFSTSTNIRFGSNQMPSLWWNATTVEIPSISLDISKMNSRPGAMSGIGADTCAYSDLGVDLVIDKEWNTYREIYNFFLEGLNVENAKFSTAKVFDLWIEFVDGKGDVVQRFDFHQCRLQEFSGVVATPNDAEDTLQTLTLSFAILYYTHSKGNPWTKAALKNRP